MKTGIKYVITFGDGSTLLPNGYSKYSERLQRFNRFELPAGEMVYGREQAIEHVHEYFALDNEYNDTRRAQTAIIKKVVTTEEVVDRLTWSEEKQGIREFDDMDKHLRETNNGIGGG